MLYACVQRFDVTGNLKNFVKFLGSKQAPSISSYGRKKPPALLAGSWGVCGLLWYGRAAGHMRACCVGAKTDKYEREQQSD
jgi:hypothetical protein